MTTDNKKPIGYLRLAQIIGQSAVTEEQAADHRRKGKSPTQPRAAIAALIPIGASTWWAGVKSGRFPQPVKLGPHTTAWSAASIMALIERLAGREGQQ